MLMDSIKSRVSYLKGLMDGLKIDANDNEGKVIREIVDVLEEIADELDELTDSQKDMEEYVDNLDENLAYIEDELFDDEDDDYDEEDIDGFVEVACPDCGETVYIDSGILDEKESIICPNCHKDIPLQFECDGHCGECTED
ncbi:hypothetical protein SDC9_181767 [bioreactor metagenome]|uniref:Zinc ribbon domain-containing protein n=1 Tax=bioreactor metagenome TaxID=1076179 RepID=A0A645HDU9_9ZZZZ